MKRLILSTLAAAPALLASSVNAALLYPTPGSTVTQDFDQAAGGATTAPWVNNSTIPNWYAYQFGGSGGSAQPAGPVPEYRRTNGYSATGATDGGASWLYHFRGNTTTTDHALGAINKDAVGDMAIGIPIQNNTGETLGSFNLGYTGEQWADRNTTAQSLTVAYRIGSDENDSSLSDANSWTSIPALTFTSPTNNGNAGVLDGNAAGNRTVFSPVLIDDINWEPGQILWIRWFDANQAGNDHGLAVDDVNFSAAVIPEPASMSLLALGLTLLGRRRRN
jgi:hypothetical protein